MKIITFATKCDGALPQLKSSFQRFRRDMDELVIVGFNKPWRGFGDRVHQVAEYARQCQPNDLLLCIDAYDVVLTGDLALLESTFEKIVTQANLNDQDTVIISEEKLKPFEAFWATYFTFGSVNNKHLSAGAYIGKGAAVTRMLNIICSNPNSKSRNFDDQMAFNQAGKLYPDLFYFDSKWDIFASCNKSELDHDLHPESNGTLSYGQGQSPLFVLHMPGNANMKSVLHRLGYNTSDYRHREKYMLQLYWHGIKSFQPILWLHILTIISIGVVIVLILCNKRKKMINL